MNFIARLTAPNGNNKYYIHTSHGGYNKCILINKSTGSVLPNCVGYAWGRFCEAGSVKDCELSKANAENWYNFTDNYKRSNEAQVGAVICWSKGKVGVPDDGAGHVGIVEKITDTQVTVSMSAYNGSRWYVRTFKKGTYDYNGFKFQGFILNPYIDFNKKTFDEIANEVIIGKWGNGATRIKKLTEAGYTESERKEIQKRVNALMAKRK